MSLFSRPLIPRSLFFFAIALTPMACAVAQAPAVVVLPGEGKATAEFQQDAAVCRQFAVVQYGGDEYAYDQCMAARGNIVEAPPANYALPPYAYAYPYPYGYPGFIYGGGLFAGFCCGFHQHFLFRHDHFVHSHFAHGGSHHGGGHH